MSTICPLLTVFVGPDVELTTETRTDAAQVVAGLVVQLINHRREGQDPCGANHLAVRFVHATDSSIVLLNCGDVSLTLELHEDDIDQRDETGLKEFVSDITTAIANHGPFSKGGNQDSIVVHCQVDWRRHMACEVLF